MRTGVVRWIRQSVRVLEALGPYAAIALALPGGSVIAIFLWLWRRRQAQLSVWKRRPASETASRSVRARMLEPATARAAR